MSQEEPVFWYWIDKKGKSWKKRIGKKIDGVVFLDSKKDRAKAPKVVD